jgi:DNA-binding response OmpR family regulator
MPAARPFVLLVDDQIDLLSQIESFLVSRGCRVLATTSPVGVSALPRQPDVTVLDVMSLDGESLGTVLDSQEHVARHVILFSALGDEYLERLVGARTKTSWVKKHDGLPALWDAIRARAA